MSASLAQLRSLAVAHQKAMLALRRRMLPQIRRAGQRIVDCLSAGGKILTCGNGGSAADALHLAEELIGRYHADRRPLPAVCLNADPTALTCIANDYGYQSVFARQVTALARRGDILVAFSTSGNSPNILAALLAAKKNHAATLLLSGQTGGKARADHLPDFSLLAPSADTARIQELHIFIVHCLCQCVEDWLEEEAHAKAQRRKGKGAKRLM